MPILHTVNSSPFQTHALAQCLNVLNDQDCLLLIEDGVIAAQAKHVFFERLSLLSEQGRLMVLDSDLAARGVVKKIGMSCSYDDFVTLVIDHKSQIAW